MAAVGLAEGGGEIGFDAGEGEAGGEGGVGAGGDFSEFREGIGNCAGADEIFGGELAVTAGAEERDVGLAVEERFGGGGGVDEGGGEQRLWRRLRRQDGVDGAGAVGGGEEDDAVFDALGSVVAGRIAQIEAGGREGVQFAAEELGAVEFRCGVAGGVDGFEAADFGGAVGDGVGERGGGAEHVEDGDGAAREVLGFEIAGVEEDVEFHDEWL